MPGDWVDEGKLLLFIRQEVAPRPPRRGRRLTAEKKKRPEDKAQGQQERRKKAKVWRAAGEEEVNCGDGGGDGDREAERPCCMPHVSRIKEKPG